MDATDDLELAILPPSLARCSKALNFKSHSLVFIGLITKACRESLVGSRETQASMSQRKASAYVMQRVRVVQSIVGRYKKKTLHRLQSEIVQTE